MSSNGSTNGSIVFVIDDEVQSRESVCALVQSMHYQARAFDSAEAFLEQAPIFEKQLTDDGILLFKYWLTTDQDRQEERLRERLDDPLKRWKLSPVDLAARERYDAYTEAREAMLRATHKEHAPWTLVDFNDQKRGRLTLIRDLLDRLPDMHVEPPAIEYPEFDGEYSQESFSVIEPISDYPID